jgi:uncharacterized membrane protein
MELTKTIEIRVPVSQAYELWTHFEHFADILDNVKSIQRLDDKRSAWTLLGPLNTEVKFISEIKEMQPNQAVAWHVVDGDVPHDGVVRFSEQGPDATRVDFKLTFTPPGGQLGEKIAQLGDQFESEYVATSLQKIKIYLEGQKLASGRKQ